MSPLRPTSRILTCYKQEQKRLRDPTSAGKPSNTDIALPNKVVIITYDTFQGSLCMHQPDPSASVNSNSNMAQLNNNFTGSSALMSPPSNHNAQSTLNSNKNKGTYTQFEHQLACMLVRYPIIIPYFSAFTDSKFI